MILLCVTVHVLVEYSVGRPEKTKRLKMQCFYVLIEFSESPLRMMVCKNCLQLNLTAGWKGKEMDVIIRNTFKFEDFIPSFKCELLDVHCKRDCVAVKPFQSFL